MADEEKAAAEKATINDHLAKLYLSGFDFNPDIEGLRAALVEILSRGKAGPETQKWIASLLVPDTNTFYRLEVSQRTPGNPQSRLDANKMFFTIYDIWREIENKRSFVRIAQQKTGLSENTIRKHLKAIVEMEKATAEE